MFKIKGTRKLAHFMIFSLVLLLVMFSLVIVGTGYSLFTRYYSREYSESAYRVGLTAEALIKTDHLDMHHHLSDNKNIKSAVIDIAKQYNIPIRNEFECDVLKPNVLYKDFTIKNVSIESLGEMISKYHDKDIVIELMTHPGYVDDYTKGITSYIEREKELKVLKEANEKGVFDKIELINFKQLQRS